MKKQICLGILISFMTMYSFAVLNNNTSIKIAGVAAKYSSGKGKLALSGIAMGCNSLGGLAISGVITAPEGIALCCLGA